MEEVTILEYESAYADDFRKLNLEWLDHYHLTESHDLMVLNDPEGTIIRRGGAIFLAECNGEIVGSAALMPEEPGVYELVKMAVTKKYQGRGISKMLIEKCLEKAKDFRAKRITLFSNHQLLAALSLYEKYGFRHVEVKHSPFETADVKMELEL